MLRTARFLGGGGVRLGAKRNCKRPNSLWFEDGNRFDETEELRLALGVQANGLPFQNVTGVQKALGVSRSAEELGKAQVTTRNINAGPFGYNLIYY